MAEDKARFRAAQRTEQRLSKSHFDGIGQGSARRDNMIRRTGPSVVARLPVRLVGAGWRGSPEKGGFPGRALGALPANYLGSAQPEEKPTARSSPG